MLLPEALRQRTRTPLFCWSSSSATTDIPIWEQRDVFSPKSLFKSFNSGQRWRGELTREDKNESNKGAYVTHLTALLLVEVNHSRARLLWQKLLANNSIWRRKTGGKMSYFSIFFVHIFQKSTYFSDPFLFTFCKILWNWRIFSIPLFVYLFWKRSRLVENSSKRVHRLNNSTEIADSFHSKVICGI